MQIKPGTFKLYPEPCPAGYSLALTGQVNSANAMECQCDEGNTLIIHCENDQDKVIVEV